MVCLAAESGGDGGEGDGSCIRSLCVGRESAFKLTSLFLLIVGTHLDNCFDTSEYAALR